MIYGSGGLDLHARNESIAFQDDVDLEVVAVAKVEKVLRAAECQFDARLNASSMSG